MCELTTLAMISGGMNVLGAVQGHQAQKAAYNANKQNALQANEDELRQINLQEAQEDTKAAEEQLANDLNTMQTASRALVAGGESGALLNNNAILQDIERQGEVANTGITRNFGNTQQQLKEERLGARTRAQSRINSVAKPSSTATALKIGSAVASAATDYRMAEKF